MRNVVMIPALGYDGRLHADLMPRLAGVVQPVSIVADKSGMADCVQQALAYAPDHFIVLGTSF